MGAKVSKSIACVHLMPTLDALEIIQVDEKTGEVLHSGTASTAIALGEQGMRQLPDVESLKDSIQALYAASGVPYGVPTVLVLPGFFTREVESPMGLSRDEIRMTLVSEAERFYVFKKAEPTVSWFQMNDATLLYTAFPQQEIDTFIEAFKELKIPLAAIDLNYLSILRGIIVSGSLGEDFGPADNWCLMVISDNLFFMALLEGTRLEKTVETPLNLSESTEDEILQDIQQDFQEFAGYALLEKCFLIVNTPRLNGRSLADRLGFQSQIIHIQQDAGTIRSLGNSDAPLPCSLEAIGGAFYPKFKGSLPSVNFLPETGANLAEELAFKEQITRFLWIANGVALVLGLAVWGVMSALIMAKEGQIKELNVDSEPRGGVSSNIREVKIKQFAQRIQEHDVKMNDLVVKLGVLVPNEAWLNDVVVQKTPDGKGLSVSIHGGSMIPEPVSQLRNGLKQALGIEDLEVSKVDLATGPGGQSYYDWMIVNKAAAPAPPQNQGG